MKERSNIDFRLSNRPMLRLQYMLTQDTYPVGMPYDPVQVWTIRIRQLRPHYCHRYK